MNAAGFRPSDVEAFTRLGISPERPDAAQIRRVLSDEPDKHERPAPPICPGDLACSTARSRLRAEPRGAGDMTLTDRFGTAWRHRRLTTPPEPTDCATSAVSAEDGA